MLHLLQLLNGDVVRSSPVTQSQVNIGRDPESDVLFDSQEISRHHARLVISDELFLGEDEAFAMLTDLGSTYGVWVEGQQVWYHELKICEPFTVGEHVTLALSFSPTELYATPIEDSDPEPEVKETVELASAGSAVEMIAAEIELARLERLVQEQEQEQEQELSSGQVEKVSQEKSGERLEELEESSEHSVLGEERVEDTEPLSAEEVEEPSAETSEEEPSSEIAVEEPSAETSEEEPSSEVAVEESSAETSEEEPSSEVAVEEPSAETSEEEPSSEIAVEEPSAETSEEEPSSEVVVEESSAETSEEEPSSEIAVEESSAETSEEEPSSEIAVEESSAETSEEEPSSEVAVEESSAETPEEEPSSEVVAEELSAEGVDETGIEERVEVACEPYQARPISYETLTLVCGSLRAQLTQLQAVIPAGSELDRLINQSVRTVTGLAQLTQADSRRPLNEALLQWRERVSKLCPPEFSLSLDVPDSLKEHLIEERLISALHICVTALLSADELEWLALSFAVEAGQLVLHSEPNLRRYMNEVDPLHRAALDLLPLKR